MILAAYFILRGRETHIDFLRLLFLVGVICPLMQEYSLRLKKAHKSRAGRRHVKDQKTSNRVLRADQNSHVNQTCQQSVFTPIGACIRI